MTSDFSAVPFPTGTVTLLFTDIEGSTRLWETQEVLMRTALARHDQLLRYSIQRNRGRVFKTVGDAFCAAFATASDAVAAAIEAQRSLHLEHWPEPIKIRVRLALHTGAVEMRDGDYFGPPLNRVARLLSAGHGGQSLLSETTHDLCRDHLPPLASVKPLGEHALRDLSRREPIFQICHPDLVQNFPALKTERVSTDQDAPSIAVLPFTNMTGDHENEYFADGLAEELLNVLTKIAGLRVVSRTSAFSFRGKNVDIPTVARQLNVATVLQGSVRKAGKHVRVTAQLIKGTTDSHLWSETYDRELDDIFVVQDDIAQSVVRELRIALRGEGAGASAQEQVKAEVQVANVGRASIPDAHRLYLQGKFFSDRNTEEDTARGLAYLQQAVARDPKFALAFVALSYAFANQSWSGWRPLAEGVERARECVQRALALEPNLPEAHVALGMILLKSDWNVAGANVEFQRAFALAPGNHEVLTAVGVSAMRRGRLDEAIATLRQAVVLDPVSARATRILGYAYGAAGRHDEAAEWFQASLDLNPNAQAAHYCLSTARLLQGRAAEALEIAGRETERAYRLLATALAAHTKGNKAESNAALAQFVNDYADNGEFQIALAYAWRGEIDLAFGWLERGYTNRDPGLSECALIPFLRPLHADPRWLPFITKLGLVDSSSAGQDHSKVLERMPTQLDTDAGVGGIPGSRFGIR